MKKTIFTLILALVATVNGWSENTFVYQSKIFSILDEDAATLKVVGCDYNLGGLVEIPATVEHAGKTYVVACIGEGAFSDYRDITAFILPATLIDIESKAFAGCIGLSSIVIKNTIPPTVAADAFTGVSTQMSVSVPLGSLDSYKETPVWGLFVLMEDPEFTVDNLKYTADPEAGTAELSGFEVAPKGRLTIYATVYFNGRSYDLISLGFMALAHSTSLVEVTIPNSVVNIGYEAFYDCTSLESVTIGSGVTNIDGMAFGGCSAIRDITIRALVPPEVSSSDAFHNVPRDIPVYVPTEALEAYKAADVWKEFTNLQAYKLPEFSVDYMKFRVLSEVDKKVELVALESDPWDTFEIPKSITCNDEVYTVAGIGKKAFYNFATLTKVNIPYGIEYIADNAFDSCTAVTEITSDAAVPPTVGTDAFKGVPRDIPVYVPIESVAAYKAADGWKEFTNIQFSPQFTVGNLIYNITDANAMTVKVAGYVPGVASALEIPASVAIAGMEFSVTSIGDNSFHGCEAITSLTLPNSVTTIEMNAFGLCSNLKEVDFGDGMETIGFNTFRDCKALTKLTMGSSLTSIDECVFYGCTGITEMTVRALVPPTVGTDAFYDVPRSIPVYVPDESLEAYKAADEWKEFNVQSDPSSVSELAMPESIRVYGGMLRNPEGLALCIYDLTGRIVYSGNATTLSLTAGVYVVRCNGAIGKIMF